MNDYMCNEVRQNNNDTTTVVQATSWPTRGQEFTNYKCVQLYLKDINFIRLLSSIYEMNLARSESIYINWINSCTEKGDWKRIRVTCVYGTDNILQIVWNKQPVNTFNGRTRMRFCKVSYSWVPLTGTQDEFCIIV